MSKTGQISDAVAVATGVDVNYDGLYIATAGNVTIVKMDGNSVTFNNLIAGSFLPVKCKQVTSAPADTLGYNLS